MRPVMGSDDERVDPGLPTMRRKAGQHHRGIAGFRDRAAQTTGNAALYIWGGIEAEGRCAQVKNRQIRRSYPGS